MQSFAMAVRTLFINRSDAILVIGVLLIIGMLIVPLPTWMLDSLIAVNIGCAALVLLMALYVSDATRFAAFPSILLLTTLFRLALNVSSTRLILRDADAGQVIQAFGDFVVGGNYVVGGIIFLILILIQFIVIAKGSERVAEVAARFTLDAMPGKQMSIDADLRAGLLTAEQARIRRRAIERESQLYGAMDGAMKFVKGDAIAGIVIAIVNIIGGLIVGTTQLGLSLGDAAAKFSLLTIGDGLVSQIPALLLSTSAGLVVTRVASTGDCQDEHIARSIIEQILAQPRAIAFCSLILFGAACVPGFPTIVFVVLGVGVFGMWTAIFLSSERASDRQVSESSAIESLQQDRADNDARVHHRAMSSHLVLEIHGSLLSVCGEADISGVNCLQSKLDDQIASLRGSMGVDYPNILVRQSTSHLPEYGFAVLINEALIMQHTVSPLLSMVPAPARQLRALGIRAKQVRIPWNHAPGCMISEPQIEQARLGGLPVLGPSDIVLQEVVHTILRYSREFVGLQESEHLLNRMRQSHAVVVQQVTPKPISLQLLTETIQRLLAEAVPIRNLRGILESLAKWGRQLQQPSARELADLVRRDLRRCISAHYASGRTHLGYFQIGTRLMTLFEESVGQSVRGFEIVLTPKDRGRVVSAIAKALDTVTHSAAAPVLMCEDRFRSMIRDAIAWDYPGLAVMSWSEVAPEIQQQCIGVVELSDPQSEGRDASTGREHDAARAPQTTDV